MPTCLACCRLRRALRGVQSDVAFARFVERFFVQPEAARTTAKAIAARHPELAARTHDKAQEALDHIVDLLGSGPTQLGERIDWQCDFKTGFTWPIDVLGYDQDGLRLGNPCDAARESLGNRACRHAVDPGRDNTAYRRRARIRFRAGRYLAPGHAWPSGGIFAALLR